MACTSVADTAMGERACWGIGRSGNRAIGQSGLAKLGAGAMPYPASRERCRGLCRPPGPAATARTSLQYARAGRPLVVLARAPAP